MRPSSAMNVPWAAVLMAAGAALPVVLIVLIARVLRAAAGGGEEENANVPFPELRRYEHTHEGWLPGVRLFVLLTRD